MDWLARQGLLVYDPVVDAALQGPLKGCDPRTVQRHFRRSTGLTLSTTWHIEARALRYLSPAGRCLHSEYGSRGRVFLTSRI